MTRSHHHQTAAFDRVIAAAADLDAALDGVTDQFDEARAALAAACRAATQTRAPAAGGPTPFDAYEVAPCLRFEEPDRPGHFYFEPCEPAEADVWTVYGHIPGEGVEAIGDFDTRSGAEEVVARITGRPYGG